MLLIVERMEHKDKETLSCGQLNICFELLCYSEIPCYELLCGTKGKGKGKYD